MSTGMIGLQFFKNFSRSLGQVLSMNSAPKIWGKYLSIQGFYSHLKNWKLLDIPPLFLGWKSISKIISGKSLEIKNKMDILSGRKFLVFLSKISCTWKMASIETFVKRYFDLSNTDFSTSKSRVREIGEYGLDQCM